MAIDLTNITQADIDFFKQWRETTDTKIYRIGSCKVMISCDSGKYHLSISHPTRYPKYDEIKEARYKFCPNDAVMAMLFPPKEQFVNIHSNCFHLFQIN